MPLVSAWLFFCSRAISPEISTAESSCAKRSSSMRPSSSATGCSKARKVVFMARGILNLVFDRHRIEAAPQLPRRNRAVRRPGRAELAHARERNLAPLEIVQAQCLLQAEVVERKHVGAQQVEHQEHLRGPA